MGILQHILGRPVGRIDRDLRNQTDPTSLRDCDLPFVLIELADQDTEESGFSTAVMAKNADALSGKNGETQTVQYIPANLKGFDKIVYGYFNHGVFLFSIF